MAVDMQRRFTVKKVIGGEQPYQAIKMVAMEVRDKNTADFLHWRTIALHLYLRTLAAIDKKVPALKTYHMSRKPTKLMKSG